MNPQRRTLCVAVLGGCVGAWLWLAFADGPVGVLQAAAPGTTFSGTVAGSDQGFLTGASVVIDGPARKEATTDADGRFAMADVARGRYQLRVVADGYLPIERPLEVGTAAVSVDIVLLRLPGL
ncbi:MAG: carboxypeptidase regulatory-like domain-containing protein [Acidobacteria bacterium]|nr:carboxypeptidase regulatory-like domain-containing protein [Acidobacteriota bacterium]